MTYRVVEVTPSYCAKACISGCTQSTVVTTACGYTFIKNRSRPGNITTLNVFAIVCTELGDACQLLPSTCIAVISWLALSFLSNPHKLLVCVIHYT